MVTVVRDARIGDEPAVARVHVAAWRAAYVDLMPSGYLASLREEDRARRYHFGDGSAHRTLVAESSAGGVEDRITGFITFGACSEDAAIGEVYALNVDPRHWGNGVGSRLLAAAMTELARAGHARAVLWVLAGNRRARRFYEYHGWSADGGEREDQLDRFPGPQGWGTVTEVRYAVGLSGARPTNTSGPGSPRILGS